MNVIRNNRVTHRRSIETSGKLKWGSLILLITIIIETVNDFVLVYGIWYCTVKIKKTIILNIKKKKFSYSRFNIV